MIVEEHLGDVMRLTIDRPPANALSTAVVTDLADRIVVAGLDDSVRALVLTGAGQRFFTAGGDFKELAGAGSGAGEKRVREGHRLLVAMQQLPQPFICAVNGDAVGIGTEFCAFADWTIAVAHARFGMPEINHGLLPMAIGMRQLARVLGLRRARQLLYRGTLVSANDAHVLGLVDEIGRRDDMNESAIARARELGSKPRELFTAIKRTLAAGDEMSADELEEATVKDFRRYYEADDARTSLESLVRRSGRR